MKIAILCNSGSWGGLEINSFKLACWLKDKGHEVSLLCPDLSTIYSNGKQAGLEVKKITPLIKYADPIEALRIKNFLVKKQVDALLICTSKDIHLGVLASLFAGNKFKIIYQQQMEIGVDKKDFVHSFFYKKLDSWIAPLPWLAENTKQRTKIPAEKIVVIPLCLEVDKFSDVNTSKEEARRHFQLPEGTFLAGTIGRLDPGKGQHILIEAVKILKDSGEEVHGVILGDETKNDTRAYPQMLRKMVENYGLQNQVHFRPFTNDMPVAFHALDVFIMAATAETYGMVTIEAMASGIPVIGAKAGGTQFLIKQNYTGLFFKNEDAADLAQQIKKIKSNPSQAWVLGQNGKKVAKENYSHHLMCDKIIELIQTGKISGTREHRPNSDLL
jgi:D-inositol-3-phosphate glycosyltransferase